eukprot:25610_1
MAQISVRLAEQLTKLSEFEPAELKESIENKIIETISREINVTNILLCIQSLCKGITINNLIINNLCMKKMVIYSFYEYNYSKMEEFIFALDSYGIEYRLIELLSNKYNDINLQFNALTILYKIYDFMGELMPNINANSPLIPILIELLSNKHNECKRMALMLIGYICELNVEIQQCFIKHNTLLKLAELCHPTTSIEIIDAIAFAMHNIVEGVITLPIIKQIKKKK